MGLFSSYFLSLFEEEGAMAKVAVLSLLFPIPVANFFVLGYWRRLVVQIWNAGTFSLPEPEFSSGVFGEGWQTFLLNLIVFSPSLGALAAAGFSFLFMIRGGQGGYVGNFLVVLLFVFVACTAFFFSSLIIPIFFFRFMESGELGWAVQPSQILGDLNQIGRDYWEDWVSALVIMGLGELLILPVSAFLLLFSPGKILGPFFFVFFSSLLWVYVITLSLKRLAPMFKELHYRYTR